MLTSKVIDGAFPPYESVIPRQNPRVLVVDNDLFAAAIDRVATISTDQSRAVKLLVESGRMTLSVQNIDASHAVEELEIDYDGPPFDVGFNARYVLDVAAQIGGERAEFRFAEEAAGATVSGAAMVLDPTDAGRPVRADVAARLGCPITAGEGRQSPAPGVGR